MTRTSKIIWSSWLIASIFYAYQYILRVMPNIMFNDLVTQFQIDSALFGQFSGFYYIGYSLMHLPIGILLDRFGPKKVMPVCIFLTTVGLLPILFSDHWLLALIGRFLIGIGSSAAILGTFKVIRLNFEEKHFARMLSFSVTIGLLGAIYGGGPVGYMNKTLGYQAVVQILALMGVVLAIVSYLIMPQEKQVESSNIIKDLKTVFSNKKVLTICFLAGLMVGPMEGFSDAWGAPFLQKVYGFDSVASGYLCSMIYIGMCFAPALSFIAEKTRSYFGVIIASALIMAAAFVAVVLLPLSYLSVSVGLFITGICCAYQILAIYKASTYVPNHVTGLTTAVANMIIMIFGYVFHSGIGYVIHVFGGLESPIAFKYGIAFIPVTLFIAAIGYILISLGEQPSLKGQP